MIKTNAPYITCWRGDNVAGEYSVRLVSTSTLRDYVYEELVDMTPHDAVITLVISDDGWDELPSGEYEYSIDCGDNVVACGILVKEGADVENSEYITDYEYVEYNG